MVNCTGTVSAIQYCYSDASISLDNQLEVFTLFLFEQEMPQRFRTTDVVNVRSTPTSEICRRGRHSRFYCCDTMQISPFLLPSASFAYGVVGDSILRYSGLSQYDNVEYFNFSPGANPTVGTFYSVSNDGTEDSRDVRLLQFIIGRFFPLPLYEST